ncbi:TPR-like protein [Mycena sanguinolenta]|uniref:TPR-like protein n=1 Tax=Mycena sanguinolenta TaxID=230812 RepID=A0A8H7D4E2_9AGAR|nr:TPR-like protein [Mycena sanguinolenta]
MNSKSLLKLKLEAIEDDKILLAAAIPRPNEDSSSDDGDSSDLSDSDSVDSISDEDEEPEDVKPIVKTEAASKPGGSDIRDGDGEFERLVQNIRLDSSAGTLAKEWDFTIHDQTDSDLRTASEINGRSRRPATKCGPPLSFQTKALIGEGNQAYVDGDLPGAIRIMMEVIRIEPRAPAAWSVLAQCYEDQKDLASALQLRIMGAHLKNDAEEWDRLARQSREMGHPQQALYCWAKGYHIDPTNMPALWDRAMLAKEIGDFRTARIAFLGILQRYPHDIGILGELRIVLIELHDLSTAAAYFQAAFDHYRTTFPSGSGPDRSSGLVVPGAGFGLLELLALADLYNTVGEHERAIDVIRKGMRWLQGRAAESFWDLCADDREYDCENADVVRESAEDDYDDELVEAGCYELDVNARQRLAIARIKLGDIEEGKIHAAIVLGQDILDYAPLFCEIADAFFDRELFSDALAIYEVLGSNETTSSVYILQQTAECMRANNELHDAAQVYEAIRKAEPNDNEYKMKLAEIYEILNEPRKALDLVYEVIDSRKRRPKEDSSSTVAPDRAAGGVLPLIQDVKPRIKAPARKSKSTNRLSNTELREMEAQKEKEAVEGYRRLKQLWPRMLEGEVQPLREWMLDAEKLTEAFRETRRLFNTSRSYQGMFPRRRTGKLGKSDEDKILCRLQLELAHDTTARKTRSGDKYNRVDVFRGINFDDWLRLFFQYSFILTKSGNYDRADEVLRHLMLSNAYQLPTAQDAIRVALITCATAAGRFPVVVEQSRKLSMTRQFHNEPMRIMMSSLGSGFSSADAFNMSTFQKYLHREMKMFDTAANNPDALIWSPQNKRFSTKSVGGADGFEDDEDEPAAEEDQKPATSGRKKLRAPRLPDIATKPNPFVLALYGQMCLVSKSYQSAIFYLLMAFDLSQEDPMISLCITIASLGRATHRQCDNRHQLVAQAMAFLARYRTYRALSGNHVVEIEYNIGRTFHQLALYSHAARHYECALAAAAENPKATSCAAEAAYNLSMIYTATGARTLAIELHRRWLSL